MFFYTGINLIVLFIAFISYMLYIKRKQILHIEKTEETKKDYTNNFFFVVCVFLILVIITGLRGQFSVDYGIYYDIFTQVKEMSIFDIFYGKVNVEIGYALLNKVISYVFSNCIYLMLVIAMITVYSYLKVFRKYSKSVYISTILLLCIGSYYTSFNTTRIALAAALVFLSSSLLYKKEDMWRYFLCMILISTIHKSALIMIPLYFVLQFKMFDSKNRKYLILIVCPLIIVFFFFGRTIVNQIATIFYPSYTNNGYGMDWGNSIITLCRPIAIIVFLYMHRKYIDLKDKKEKIWVNATVLFLIISILACNIRILYRFYYYVQPFALLLIPNILCKMPQKKKKVWTCIVLLSAIIYLLLANILNNEVYYFIWQYKIYNY